MVFQVECRAETQYEQGLQRVFFLKLSDSGQIVLIVNATSLYVFPVTQAGGGKRQGLTAKTASSLCWGRGLSDSYLRYTVLSVAIF